MLLISQLPSTETSDQKCSISNSTFSLSALTTSYIQELMLIKNPPNLLSSKMGRLCQVFSSNSPDLCAICWVRVGLNPCLANYGFKGQYIRFPALWNLAKDSQPLVVTDKSARRAAYFLPGSCFSLNEKPRRQCF
jgi:hypothetical protein